MWHWISASVMSLWAATLWNADTTVTRTPSNVCARVAALPSAGAERASTLVGTSGTVVSTTILPTTSGAISASSTASGDASPPPNSFISLLR